MFKVIGSDVIGNVYPAKDYDTRFEESSALMFISCPYSAKDSFTFDEHDFDLLLKNVGG